jgi:hypothetical protein
MSIEGKKYLLTKEKLSNPEGLTLEVLKIHDKIDHIQLLKGDKGDSITGPPGKIGPPGKDGYTPKKGTDYFDGKPGKDGYTPVKGKDYFDGKPGKTGSPGKDADENRIIRETVSLIPTPQDGSPDTAEEVRDKLASLKGNARLDISAIKNFPKESKKKLDFSDLRWHGSGSSVATAVVAIDLSSQCDGETTLFTLPKFTTVLLLSGTQFPIIYKPGDDFITPDSTHIQLTSQVSAPEAGQTLIALVI